MVDADPIGTDHRALHSQLSLSNSKKRMFRVRRMALVRLPTPLSAQCKFVAAEHCAKRNRIEFDGNRDRICHHILPENTSCTGFPAPMKIFALCDQTVAVAIPPTHDALSKFCLRGLQPASGLRRCVLGFRHVNEGGTCLGHDLETECAGGLRDLRIRRRDFGGGNLSSRVG